MVALKQYRYRVTTENYNSDGEFIGTQTQEVIAPRCNIAADRVENEPLVYVVNVERLRPAIE